MRRLFSIIIRNQGRYLFKFNHPFHYSVAKQMETSLNHQKENNNSEVILMKNYIFYKILTKGQQGTVQQTQLITEEVNGKMINLFNTKFGHLKLSKNPFLTNSETQKINNIYYISFGVSTNFIKKILKEDKNSLIVFDAEKIHFKNAFETYQAAKKLVSQIYYGTQTSPKNPFAKCKNPKEVFHLNRRILIEQKKLLSRICLVVDYNGSLRIQGTIPECPNLKYFLDDQPTNLTEMRFRKYNYLIPFNSYQGILTAYNYEKNGVVIPQLDNKPVYSYYGVWQPTQSQYLRLLDEYMEKFNKKLDVEKGKVLNVADLGCGTGVLSFIIKNRRKDTTIYAFDNNENAVKSAILNSQCLDMKDFRALKADITEDLEGILLKNKLPQSYDLIIANPPWVQASHLAFQDPIENSVYDEDAKFLKSTFKFANKYLSNDTINSKPGRFLLIYSDLSQILHLQEKEMVEKLCREYKMIIKGKWELPFSNQESNTIDPLIKFKSESKVQLYEIMKN